MQRSLPVVDATIRRDTDSGPGFYRYGTATPGTEDGYGDCYEPDATNCSPNGKPWPTGNSGSGHVWPVLNGERAEQHLQTGEAATAARLLLGMQRFASGIGLVPEQAWENPDLPASPFGTDPGDRVDRVRERRRGRLRLTAHLGAGPAGAAHPEPRAVPAGRAAGGSSASATSRRRPPRAPVDVTAPADGATVTTATVDVTGTTTPGATVDVASTATDAGGATTRGHGARPTPAAPSRPPCPRRSAPR